MTAAATTEPAGALSPDDVLAVRALTVVPEGDEFVVGDPRTAAYVVLPQIGVDVIELLRAGRTIGEATAEASRAAGEEVDVADFADSLLALGFAERAGGAQAAAAQAGAAQAIVPPGVPRLVRACLSPVAWTLYAAAALGVLVLFALRPGLFPSVSDIFFLDTPVRSLAALTLITYALAGAHEVCHWLAARAAGVSARITIGRRLYFLTLEIDLSGLWSLPRRRRYGPLLAGMAFDAVVLLGLLVARYGDGAGWWRLSEDAGAVLAAITFVELAALMAQCWIFVRTDLYAVLITATGCVNLFEVNRLLVRRTLRLITPDQRRELAAAHARDVEVARWYRWIYVLGIAAAAWFFVAFFAPTTVHLVGWIAGSVASEPVASEHFWEALAFGLLILCPRVLTLGVALRDLRLWRRRRMARVPAAQPVAGA